MPAKAASVVVPCPFDRLLLTLAKSSDRVTLEWIAAERRRHYCRWDQAFRRAVSEVS